MPNPGFSSLEYNPLSLEHEEIRLLRIDIAGGRHTLTHGLSMRVQRLQYVALSYPWGESKALHDERCVQSDGYVYEKIHGGVNYIGGSLTINGQKIFVSLNLFHAIRSAIHFWRQAHPDENEFLLWCDQICIDQSSITEKGHQVALMGAIYERAEQVLAWLPAPGVDDLPNTLSHWRKHHELHDVQGDREKLPDPDIDLDFYRRLERACRACHNLRYIAESPWWSRAWIYQEFILGSRVTFLIDEFYIDMEYNIVRLGLRIHIGWFELRDCMKHGFSHMSSNRLLCHEALRQLSEFRNASELHKLHQQYDKQDKKSRRGAISKALTKRRTKHEVSTNQSDVTSPAPIETFGNSIAQMISTFRKFDEQASNTIDQAWAMVQFIFESKSKWSESQLASVRRQQTSPPSNASQTNNCEAYISLSGILPHSQICACSDPRDKIYAFIGLVNPSHGISADYSDENTVAHTLTSATKSIISLEKSLQVLMSATQMREPSRIDNHFPSWVPEHSLRQDQRSKYQKYLDGIELPFEGCIASGDTEPIVSFHEDQHKNPDRLLKVRGFRVDLLHRVERDESTEPWQIFTAFNTPDLRIGTRDSAKTGDEVWILLGLKVPLTLARPSRKDAYYTIIGVTMLWDGDQVSSIMQGSMMKAVDAGDIKTEDIYII